MYNVDLMKRECLSVLYDFIYDPFYIDVVMPKNQGIRICHM